MRSHAVISKSRSKKNPFKVSYIGENGEPVATSELLSTKWNCKKNIRAMINMVSNTSGIPYDVKNILVVDKTGKKETKFLMSESGYETKLFS